MIKWVIKSLIMKQQIRVCDKNIDYTLKVSKRARRIRLAVYHDGGVVVTVPQGVHPKIVDKFLTEKASWIIKKLDYFKQVEGKIVLKTSKKDYLERKAEAFRFIEKKVKYFNKFYNFEYNRICVKNQKTRWGSCSKKKNLNFNYKIIFLPENMANYIVVHELCHLKELNHSYKFWNLVATTLPDYKNIKKEFKHKILA